MKGSKWFCTVMFSFLLIGNLIAFAWFTPKHITVGVTLIALGSITALACIFAFYLRGVKIKSGKKKIS